MTKFCNWWCRGYIAFKLAGIEPLLGVFFRGHHEMQRICLEKLFCACHMHMPRHAM